MPRTLLLALSALVLAGAFLAWLLGGGPDRDASSSSSGAPRASAPASSAPPSTHDDLKPETENLKVNHAVAST